MFLSVNVDHIATLRQARLGVEPDPVEGALLAISGGADGITAHLREDRRHISDRDLKLLRQVITAPLNLEMAATDEMIAIALSVKPDMVTLVPEKRQELTTEGGLDVRGQKQRLSYAVDKIQSEGIPVSLFINPSETDVTASAETTAEMVEIHTGLYANAVGEKAKTAELGKIITAVYEAQHLGLIINAGHGLNYRNVSHIAAIREIRGLYIGHGIMSRAIMTGIEKAVWQMRDLIRQAG
ncbi:MAG: pyridoxine 5'-phosphate synthase [Nitrospirae bacterium]|nr:pyridoxine 5'-phosphate synthase [Nitrospirota bacterium]MBF0535652.1 pyridoxine 5'-phosphate synthase [Nitrospirota bacterium]MBF0616958.1 pyridoxine 5'-phosphate synthase [Nitrospirota bacterium]